MRKYLEKCLCSKIADIEWHTADSIEYALFVLLLILDYEEGQRNFWMLRKSLLTVFCKVEGRLRLTQRLKAERRYGKEVTFDILK